MAVIGGSGSSVCLIPSRVCTCQGRSFAVCSPRWSAPVVIYSTGSAIGARELYRCGQKSAFSLKLFPLRATSGSSGERGDGDEGDPSGNRDDEEGKNDGVEAEKEGAGDGGPRDDEKEDGGFWKSMWRRKTRDPGPDEKSEEADSAASGQIEEGEEEDEENVGTPPTEPRGRWRFPWNWKAESEAEALEEEAEEQRRKREGIFVFDVDNESLELRWQDLLDPTVENVLALILTGCLVLAIVQILWQLFIVAAAITVSAIKYTVLAIFLVAILVFLV